MRKKKVQDTVSRLESMGFYAMNKLAHESPTVSLWAPNGCCAFVDEEGEATISERGYCPEAKYALPMAQTLDQKKELPPEEENFFLTPCGRTKRNGF